MNILGISAYYHDSAAALLIDGKIIAAAQEERFTRIKHDPTFPVNSIRYCLMEGGLLPSHVDYVAFYDKPFLKFERLLETYLAFAPKGFLSFAKALPIWLKDKLFQKNTLSNELSKIDPDIDWMEKLLFSEHHFSHAASAFYPSPFDRAAVLTMDGAGEWATTSLALGSGNDLKIAREIHFPHSLGLLYSAFTYYTGFKVNSGEYKVMGLAPYGKPRFANLIKDNLIDIKDDGSFRLNLEYFDYCVGQTMTNGQFDKIFGGKPRQPESTLTQREMDLAASIQVVTEEVVIKLARAISKETGERNLCLAGGVALNCVANGKLLRENIFDSIWIQPAAGDAGGALGAAYAANHVFLKSERGDGKGLDKMAGSFLGPSYSQMEIEQCLINEGAVFKVLEETELVNQCAMELANGNALGWHQGRMEYGPRALGGRSILADPRLPNMQRNLNMKVKYRESFRPFAPSILSEEAGNYFNLPDSSPYMLMVGDVLEVHRLPLSESQQNLFGIDQLNVKRSSIPAVTHVDYSARIQTVHAETNQKYHALISKFMGITGCPVLVNTSFNIRGEPVVCTPADAFKCFMCTEIDVLAIGNCILYKNDQNGDLRKNYTNLYYLD
ncbi:carbamoyltransferase [Chitinivorax sp. B]|uniref:carbamoyltransferase family protein n=1 Tax=Chitinivorax sp. B TaxID=2502235 RepID=UPI0010F7987C|nr:carbamoyltransferase [Chitinivorax sp. B]